MLQIYTNYQNSYCKLLWCDLSSKDMMKFYVLISEGVIYHHSVQGSLYMRLCRMTTALLHLGNKECTYDEISVIMLLHNQTVTQEEGEKVDWLKSHYQIMLYSLGCHSSMFSCSLTCRPPTFLLHGFCLCLITI